MVFSALLPGTNVKRRCQHLGFFVCAMFFWSCSEGSGPPLRDADNFSGGETTLENTRGQLGGNQADQVNGTTNSSGEVGTSEPNALPNGEPAAGAMLNQGDQSVDNPNEIAAGDAAPFEDPTGGDLSDRAPEAGMSGGSSTVPNSIGGIDAMATGGANSGGDTESTAGSDAEPQCVPQLEVCDGLDNNCNNEVDENFDLMTDPAHCGACNRRCSLPNAATLCADGQCVVDSCNAGFGNPNGEPDDGCECEVTNAGTERCSGVDEDCDGKVDESFDLNTDTNHCGACENSCAFANGTATCSNGQCELSGCNGGFENLNNDDIDGCECRVAAEMCNGLDDNCDGTIDNIAPSPCGEERPGECRQGALACLNGAVVCQGEIGPAAEVCDGKDNDCDGNIDEAFDADDDGFSTCIDGNDCRQCVPGQACEGCVLYDCNDGDEEIKPDAVEICGDGTDQNCDGRDTECDVTPPIARMNQLLIVRFADRNRCDDIDGDGDNDNQLGTLAPAFINGLIENAFVEGPGSANLFFIFTGVQSSAVDQRFEFSAVNGVRSDVNRRYTALQDSFDADGQPVNQFPGAALSANQLDAGPRAFTLELPIGNGPPIALNAQSARIRGVVTIPVNGDLTSARIADGILTGAVPRAELVSALNTAGQQLIANFLPASDIDQDNDGTNESISLCLSFTAEPPEFELIGLP